MGIAEVLSAPYHEPPAGPRSKKREGSSKRSVGGHTPGTGRVEDFAPALLDEFIGGFSINGFSIGAQRGLSTSLAASH